MSKIEFAKETSVPVHRTQSQIMELLRRAECSGLGFMEEGDEHLVQFKLRGRVYALRVRYQSAALPVFTRDGRGYMRTAAQAKKAHEQHKRTRWRALWLMVKALLVQVELEYMSAEEAFLPYLVLPSGQTLAEECLPRLDELQAQGAVRLLPGPAVAP